MPSCEAVSPWVRPGLEGVRSPGWDRQARWSAADGSVWWLVHLRCWRGGWSDCCLEVGRARARTRTRAASCRSAAPPPGDRPALRRTRHALGGLAFSAARSRLERPGRRRIPGVSWISPHRQRGRRQDHLVRPSGGCYRADVPRAPPDGSSAAATPLSKRLVALRWTVLGWVKPRSSGGLLARTRQAHQLIERVECRESSRVRSMPPEPDASRQPRREPDDAAPEPPGVALTA